MNILIIGGSGFVSGTLARKAVAEGHDVWAITRGKRTLPAGVRGIVADRKNTEAFSAAVRNAGKTWDLVADCIGYTPDDAEQDAALFLTSDQSICKHFVFISTDFVYHPESRAFPQPEGASTYIETGYGYEKRCCELVFAEQAKSDCWTVLRPCHIYGPGSLLGCLPEHGRDPDLIEKIRSRSPLALVGGGTYLQQPLYAEDLADAVLSAAESPQSRKAICNIAGPEIIESKQYYEIIGEYLGVPVELSEIPVLDYRRTHPEKRSFLCHRIYTMDALRQAGIRLPGTGVREALREHLESLLT